MKQKTLIERKLKFSNSYVYLETVRGSIENAQFCTCDNCGKLITNMVKVADKATKQIYYIGTDCAETLAGAKCLYNNGSQTDYRQDIYILNLVTRFVTELNKGKKYTSIWEGMKLEVTTDKGKTIECWFNDLKTYYPHLIQS
jgi:hypothetical protein